MSLYFGGCGHEEPDLREVHAVIGFDVMLIDALEDVWCINESGERATEDGDEEDDEQQTVDHLSDEAPVVHHLQTWHM